MAFEIEQPSDLDDQSAVVEPTKPRLLGVLGPGLITGASDDDPSGIATYSQAGAQFGYALTWTMIFTYPLMTAVQIVSARMGRTTGRGIAGNLRQHCPPWLLTAIVALLLIANAINIGADLGAMADAEVGTRRSAGPVCAAVRGHLHRTTDFPANTPVMSRF
jgi:Mn2+/Fe2+ NRAMP family transporter